MTDNGIENNDLLTPKDSKGDSMRMVESCRNTALFMAWFLTVMASLYLIKFLVLELGQFDFSSQRVIEWIYGLGLVVFQVGMIVMMLVSIIGIQKSHSWTVYITKWLWGLMLLWPVMMVWRNVMVFLTYLTLLGIVFYYMSVVIDWDLLVPKEGRMVKWYQRCSVTCLAILGLVLSILRFLV